MRLVALAALLGYAVPSTVVAQAAPASTRVAVQGAGLPAGAAVSITLDGKTGRTMLSQHGTGTVAILDVPEGPVEITIEATAMGYSSKRWSGTLDLNGSGQIVYVFNADGTGTIGQWPAVTWESSDALLDVLVNGAVHGSTKLRRGVEPNRDHTFVWRQSNTTKCTLTTSLPLNVRRTFTCNPATGRVEER